MKISTNYIDSLLEIEKLITASAYLLGILFIFKAIYSLKTHAESRAGMGGSQSGMKEPLVYLMVGAMLLYFPTGFQVIMTTMFTYSDVLAYAPINNGSPLLTTLFGQNSPFGYALALTIQVIGGIAFVRGWVLISRSASQGQQPGAMGQGLTHVVGGVLAMNIIGTIDVIQNTFLGL
jgi:intracellular multiplication protein IcmC